MLLFEEGRDKWREKGGWEKEIEGKKRKSVSYTCMANSVKTPHSIWLREERLEVLGRKEIYLLGLLELFYARTTYWNTNELV